MREITKTIPIPVDGNPRDFRLTKLDAFSGASLLRMLSRLPEGEQWDGSARSGSRNYRTVPDVLSSLSDADLRSLMTVCLEHTEVSLPAGWMPVMTRGEWSFPELEHDTASCLRLTVEEVLWTLEGFFGGGASTSGSGTPVL